MKSTTYVPEVLNLRGQTATGEKQAPYRVGRQNWQVRRLRPIMSGWRNNLPEAARCGPSKALASTLRKKWGSEASPGVQTGVYEAYENLRI